MGYDQPRGLNSRCANQARLCIPGPKCCPSPHRNGLDIDIRARNLNDNIRGDIVRLLIQYCNIPHDFMLGRLHDTAAEA